MHNLSHWLKKFSQVLNKDEDIKSKIKFTFNDSGINLRNEDFFLKEGVLEINTSGSVKNQIYLKESKIKDDLSKQGVLVNRILYK